MAGNPSREVAVVDDDAAVLNSFRFVLELVGYPVATYPSAIAHLERILEKPPVEAELISFVAACN
jgi:FixJ family two-component response regulator